MSRQVWLRNREIARRFDRVDPIPVEEAVLDRRADSMMDMVRRQVAAVARAARDEELPDEDLDDELGDDELVLSEYQLAEVARELHAVELEEATAAQTEPSGSPAGPASDTGSKGTDPHNSHPAGGASRPAEPPSSRGPDSVT